MSITGALFSGVSGLSADSQSMTVIGNNLANGSTPGFKSASTIFSNMLSSSIYGSGGISQVGRGVQIDTVQNDFSQGSFQTTDNGLDCAIEGSGFFMLKNPGDATDYYSRAGSFSFNAAGYLVNPEGMQVQGQLYNADGTLAPGNPTAIQVQQTGLSPAKATSTMSLDTNLDSTSTEIPAATAFSTTDDTTFNYSTSTQVYDSQGDPHLLTVYFRKEDQASGGAANTWDWYWSSTDAAGNTIGSTTNPAGSIAFNSNGSLTSGGSATLSAASLAWGNGATSSPIALTFDTTQYDSSSTVISQTQDGYAAGNLTGISIATGGVVTAAYDNGVKTKIANLVLGSFTNPDGLESAGNSLYEATAASGSPLVGLPGTQLGTVSTDSLEQSNVDTGTQFVQMIAVQSDFDANSKIITTVDQMLQDVINMKQ